MTAIAVQPENGTTSTALARRPSQVSLLRPIAPAADVIVAQNETRELIQKALVENRDFGTIKGTKKPTLYKAGAERIVIAFGCFARFRTLASEVDHDREFRYTKREKVWRNKHKGDKEFTWKEEAGISQGLYRYVVECEIVNRQTNEVVGSFIGSCSSMESKYIDRPRDVENTILKMAEKRALVGAGLTTFGLSDQFTQDVEDLADNRGAAEDVSEQVEIVKDLAWAKAFPLPFPTHKHYNEPIDTRETKELQGFFDWATRKIEEAGGKGEEPRSQMIDFKEALRLVLEDREAIAEKDQTKLDLDQQVEAATTPEGSPPKSTNVKMPPPGKVSDALPKVDPTSNKAYFDRAKKALESPAIDVKIRDEFQSDKVNGFKREGKTLEWWVKELERIVADDQLPF
jgi:hypothetical protein